MRITGGELGGRRFNAPRGIRPTQEKVREALFSSIGEGVTGTRFLDLFAGSGAIGLEAWSRGAQFVCWVEQDPKVLAALRRNVEEMCGKGRRGGEQPTPNASDTSIFRSDAIRFLEKNQSNESFDIIFADPPYNRKGGKDWLRKILRALDAGNMLADRGTVVIEQGARESDPCPEDLGNWNVSRTKTYGGTRLRFMRK